jgi:hypothetical protein
MQNRQGSDPTVEELEQLRDPELWLGSHYELALAMPLGCLGVATRVRFLTALQDGAHVRGYVSSRQDLGAPWLPLDDVTAQANYHWGVLRIPGKRLIGCMAMVLENEFEAWCELAIPVGMLELIYPVAYPIDPATPWAGELDAFLAGLASRIYPQMPFTFGALGEEASAFVPTAEGVAAAALEGPGLIVPSTLFQRYNLMPHGTLLRDGLWWTGPWTEAR